MKRILSIFIVLAITCFGVIAQESPKEEDFYRIVTPPVPEDILLEVGGLATLPNGNLAIATRRGDVWILENPTSSKPYYRKFASGLHEALGLEYKDGALYTSQRGELTKLIDSNGDGEADIYQTIDSWPISGHYHEYSFGPKFAPDGSMFASGNVAFGSEEWWRGESRVQTRGWIFKVKEDGTREMWATGVRSPAGLGMIDGELFYTDNQGDWVGSGGIWHVKKGAFMGHPAGLKWNKEGYSAVNITEDAFYQEREVRRERNSLGRIIKPENVVDENPVTLFELKDKFPQVQTPAVWLPHGILGVSNSEIVKDNTQGKFGPFAGQLFVGDQGQSKIMRVFMEKVNGEWQGAAFDFREGFQSGVMRMAWAKDNSLFIGETNRGWGSAGDANQGLQRLVWNGKVPFEMLSVKAKSDGFEIDFTMPVDRKSAEDLASYSVSSFIYKHHAAYGSPPIRQEDLKVKGVNLSPDGKRLRIAVDGLREYYIHELNLEGIRSAENSYSLIHPTAFYTLNSIPEGASMNTASLKTYNSGKSSSASSVATAKAVVSPDGPQVADITFESVKKILRKNTCLACHKEEKKVIGPAFKDIAKRNYSDERIVELIYKPEPQNWPDYATPMAAMPQVPKAEALKIAAYINSLR